MIDTAGVRKKRHMVTNDIWSFTPFPPYRARCVRADLVLMLVDGTDPISEPDRKLGQYIAEAFEAVIFVV